MILNKLFDQKKIEHESADALKKLLDTTRESLFLLQNMGEAIEHWNSIVVHFFVKKLPIETFKLWEELFFANPT